MKKNSISYNNILPKKRVEKEQTTLKNNDTNQSSKPDMDLQDLLKKHVIFKSKVKKSEKSPTKQKSPINLTRKRNPTKINDDTIDTVKKRYKLQAIEMFDNSFDGSDNDIDIFDMLSSKTEKSPAAEATFKKKLKIGTEIGDSDGLFTTNDIVMNTVIENSGAKPLNKENIEISEKKTPVHSPSKSKKSVSPRVENKVVENPYKKVYPPKKLRLKLNTSMEDDDFTFKASTESKHKSMSPVKMENLIIDDPIKPDNQTIHEKVTNSNEIPIKSEKCVKNMKPKQNSLETKKFAIQINPTDLSDEDFDEFDTKMIVFKKSNSVTEKPVKTESNKIFSAKFYDNLSSEDDELSEKIYKKTILKRKITGNDLETSPTCKSSESPETSNKRKIFSFKRHNEDSKSLKMFNLNPNTEDINFKVETKESLNEAVCIFDSNSSRSNSPTLSGNLNANACVSIEKKFQAYEKEYNSSDSKLNMQIQR